VRIPVNQPAPRQPDVADRQPTQERQPQTARPQSPPETPEPQNTQAQTAVPTPEPESAPQQTSATAEDEALLWKEHYARLQADLENTKKRLEKRYLSEAEQKQQSLLRDMLPVADNLETALQHKNDDADSLHQGVTLTLRAFQDTMKRYGVEAIDALGQPFDPTQHEALVQIKDENTPSGYVAQVIRTGYTVDDELLRAAQVIVAA
jgi:molecular chaperone GrpE